MSLKRKDLLSLAPLSVDEITLVLETADSFKEVTGREIKISASEQTVALGSAMWGAVAAGAAVTSVGDCSIDWVGSKVSVGGIVFVGNSMVAVAVNGMGVGVTSSACTTA